ncbi:lytic transglycosylase domain-containing protein [Thermosipho atlanticus]|uniref:Transglycosylase SLT domain-containing protein n=1 Tax=Thermosipho atlanticus DSM 15807 TaxID=1123380 RepID=A0A1M5T934_9BACT|nr:lytic transglycosylase domain-containing protein [Thermosipho atlanticus]SHH47277.1 Transglycosylase SLT domain-containing protein [Thermosipho atlanticus DSM 15807]
MKKLFFILILLPSLLFGLLNDPINFLTETKPGMQIQFYTNGGKISIYYPIIYKIVSFDTFTETMRYPNIIKGLAYIESGFNIHALSYVGAMGIAQFKPDTAKDFGVVNAWNPFQALLGADRMLRFYYEKYGDISTALAIYNVGETNFNKDKEMKKKGLEYAEKVIAASKKISENISLLDRGVYYLQAGFVNNLDGINITLEVGTIFDILGQLYFDISPKLITQLSSGTNFVFELTEKTYIKLDHFNSIVFGYNLGYNNEGMYNGPIVGYSYFKPIGYSFEAYYDFSKPIDIKNISIKIGYGQKDWRVSFGFDSDFKSFYVDLKF